MVGKGTTGSLVMLESAKNPEKYLDYYHRSRTHLALGKDAPEPRLVQPPELGGVVELPEVGGLHHRYERRADSHSLLFGRSLTLYLAVAYLKKIGQTTQSIRRSVEKITSADFILEIGPKRTSSWTNFTAAKFWRTTSSPSSKGRHQALTSVLRLPFPAARLRA